MIVSTNGGYEAAMDRLRAKGWRPMAIEVFGGTLRCVAKGSAIIAFSPDGDFASEPGVMNGIAGFFPLPRGDLLREEGMDCLCGSAPGGPLDFSRRAEA